jgi:hypothetical protein
MVVTVKGGTVKNKLGDSALTAIMESQTDAWWQKPDKYKEVIKARKQSSFIPARGNIMISAFFVADLSADVINMDNRMITGPISEAGLKEYSYTLTGTTVLDGRTIHMITIAPFDTDDPLFQGKLYIADDDYSPVLFDVSLDDAALPTFFKKLEFRQQFRLFEGKYWMPVDVIVNAAATVSIIVDVDIKVEGISVLQDYAINKGIPDSVFDRTVIKVLKEADKRDSTYWHQTQLIPNTDFELSEYRKSDSIKTVLESNQNKYGPSDFLTGKRFKFGDFRPSVPGLTDMYKFNRVEGHTLMLPLGLGIGDPGFLRLRSDVDYGFGDRRLKYNFGATLRHFPLDGASLSLRVFDRVTWIDEGNDIWGTTSTTISNLFDKYDYRDYWRSKGVGANLSIELTPSFGLLAWAARQEQLSLEKTTDWSIIFPSRKYRSNPAINDGHATTAGIELHYDSRDFIDNAGEIMRIGGLRAIDPRIGAIWRQTDIASGRSEYITWYARVSGGFSFEPLGTLSYTIHGEYAAGPHLTQNLFNLQGSPDVTLGENRFSTLHFREFGGDRAVVATIEHDFGDYLFRKCGIPLLKSSKIGLTLVGRMGWTSMSNETMALQTVPVSPTVYPFYEAGFKLTSILSFFNLEFAWRLNHFHNGRNFVVGISTPLGEGGGVTISR